MAATSCSVAVSATRVNALASATTCSRPAVHCAEAPARQRLSTTAGPSNAAEVSNGEPCAMVGARASWGAGGAGVRVMCAPLMLHAAVPGTMSSENSCTRSTRLPVVVAVDEKHVCARGEHGCASTCCRMCARTSSGPFWKDERDLDIADEDLQPAQHAQHAGGVAQHADHHDAQTKHGVGGCRVLFFACNHCTHRIHEEMCVLYAYLVAAGPRAPHPRRAGCAPASDVHAGAGEGP